MGFIPSFTVPPGAKKRIEEKVKLLQKINSERPCEQCIHYSKDRMIRCGLPVGACNFNHDSFKTRSNEK